MMNDGWMARGTRRLALVGLAAAIAQVSARHTLAFQDVLMSYYTGELAVGG